jgi:tetratricopeptide (TPR) repeat protein
MIRTLVGMGIVCAVFLLPPLASASSLEKMFLEANDAFGEGRYEESVEQYEELEKLGVHSAVLFYNRATAEARLGHLGRAVQYYEKVLTLQPLDENAEFNLKVIRDYIARRANQQGRDADLAPAVGPWRTILDRFTVTSAAVAFLVCYLLLFVVLFVRRFCSGEWIRLSLGVTAGILLVVSICMGIVLLGKRHQIWYEHEAVVISVQDGLRPVYEGPSNTVKRFELEEGSRVQILENRRGYAKIRDDQGRDGWVRRETLGRI